MTHPHLLALGDSLTTGYGLAPDQSFAKQLEALLAATHGAATVHNAGVSGDTAAAGLARLPRVLARLTRRPDLAIVEFGANDLLRGVTPEAMGRSLDAILAELARCGIPALLAGMRAPPFLGGWAQRFDAVFPQVAVANRVPLYPFFLDGVVGDPTLVLADGMHPNAKAIDIVARRILPHVEAALAVGSARAA